MTFRQYAQGYLVLLVYTAATSGLDMNFWQVSAANRPLWVIGALIVLVFVVGMERQSGAPSGISPADKGHPPHSDAARRPGDRQSIQGRAR